MNENCLYKYYELLFLKREIVFIHSKNTCKLSAEAVEKSMMEFVLKMAKFYSDST